MDFDAINAAIRSAFEVEAPVLLEELESEILRLDESKNLDTTVAKLFRAAHSLKGGAATCGLTELATLAHALEAFLERLRTHALNDTTDAKELLLAAVDDLKSQYAADFENGPKPQQSAQALQQKLENGAQSPTPEAEATAGAATADANASQTRYRIHFSPHQNFFRSGDDPMLIFRQLRRLGDLETSVSTDELPPLAALDPTSLYLSWRLTLSTCAAREDITEVFAWLPDDCGVEMDVLTSSDAPAPRVKASSPPRHSAAPTRTVLAAPPPSETEKTAAPRRAPPTPVAPRRDETPAPAPPITSLRVDVAKVDALINVVGELVITQSMLASLGDAQAQTLPAFSERLERGLSNLSLATRELQEGVMRIRMLPVSVVFARFPRLIHDLSKRLGKRVRLNVEGGTTELDKTVLEQISDPIVHILRNSLDHGLECPDVREAGGKSPEGTVTLRAKHQSGNVIIEIEDDGAGLNLERIRSKAIDNGIIDPDSDLSVAEIQRLIFAPGFSTAEAVTDISGRGVGMDVVAQAVSDLGGGVAIASTEGEGTTFTITLPLTMAIVDAQLIRNDGTVYVIPLLSVVESLKVQADRVLRLADGSLLYRLRDDPIPILPLSAHFGSDTTQSIDDGLLVVVEHGASRVALLTDELLSPQQIVVKSLEHNYRRIDGLSGATILGDGEIALIVDVPALLEALRTRRAATRPSRDACVEAA